MLYAAHVPLLQEAHQSQQPAGSSLPGASEVVQATAEGVAAQAHRQAEHTKEGHPTSSNGGQKRKRGSGGQPIDSQPATSSQQQKQPLLFKQTRQQRRQSQRLPQQAQQLPQQAQQRSQQAQQLPQQAQQAQQLPQQQQQASHQLSDHQAKQKKEGRPKRKLEGAFGEVRDGEQTPGQAGVRAEEDERGKTQRLRLQEQASVTQLQTMNE